VRDERLYRARAARPSMARPPTEPYAAAAPVAMVLVAVVVGMVPLVGTAVMVGATVVSTTEVVDTTTSVVGAASELVSGTDSEVVGSGSDSEVVGAGSSPPVLAQRASVAGRTSFRATSAPHSAMTQLVAAPWTAEKLSSLQTQSKSVVVQLVSEEMASSRQGIAQVGTSARVWARATAARAMATNAYFMLKVLKAVEVDWVGVGLVMQVNRQRV